MMETNDIIDVYNKHYSGLDLPHSIMSISLIKTFMCTVLPQTQL